LTDFASNHPGGIEVLVEVSGTDATEPFDYAGHGKAALRKMESLEVGRLEGSENTIPPSIDCIPTSTPLPRGEVVKRKTLVLAIPATAFFGLWIARSTGLLDAEQVGMATSWAAKLPTETGMMPVLVYCLATIAVVGAGASFLLVIEVLKILPREKDVFAHAPLIPRPAR